MLCPRCHIEMTVVRYRAATGKGGRTTETLYRCVQCWKEKTVRDKRKAS